MDSVPTGIGVGNAWPIGFPGITIQTLGRREANFTNAELQKIKTLEWTDFLLRVFAKAG